MLDETDVKNLRPETVEVEMRVMRFIERALMGVAGLTRLRTNSEVAL